MRTQSGNSSADTLEYLQSMLGQLRLMAKAEHYDMLAYLIEIAYIEASTSAAGCTGYMSCSGSETAPPE